MTATQNDTLTDTTSSQNLTAWYAQLDALMNEQQIDALLLTSRDGHLSEYTALENNPRYHLSQFTGSVGDAIFISATLAAKLDMKAQCLLFVDGRYHIQADKQCDPAKVSVQKLTFGDVMWDSMMDWFESNKQHINKLGLDGYRFSSSDVSRLGEFAQDHGFTLHSYNHCEIDTAIELPGFITTKPITQLADELLGRGVKDNITALTSSYPEGFSAEQTCYITSVSDDVSYLLNSRGYHTPNLSSHFGYLFVINQDVVLYLPRDAAECEVNINDVGDLSFTVVRNDWNELGNLLKAKSVNGLCYKAEGINYVLQQMIDQTWSGLKCNDTFAGVSPIRVVKSPQELKAMKHAFVRSSKAIAETIRWAKYGNGEDSTYTEGALASKILSEYQAQGALGLSFSTIAGCGENGAQIHYSDNTSTRPLNDGELVLLDSGAYYEEGLATDVTRGCFCNHSRQAKPEDWQIDIYTTTLKASIAGLCAIVPTSCTGAQMDEIIRKVVKDAGYDYAHGTGHGVGIDVHESGIGISPKVKDTFTENAVVTIEPGIYLADKGGVRVENVVIVRKDENKPDHFYFEIMSFVGYDWELIDLERLTEDEKDYLKDYEQSCQNMGTEITACPLM
ncbi:MAG: M24 family metallopeptidase [Algicola sp.]|nr:M24 family metallopeptidase [Algicola sp.]